MEDEGCYLDECGRSCRVVGCRLGEWRIIIRRKIALCERMECMLDY